MTENLTIAVIGAGGKMGQRVSNNLRRTDHTVYYCETSPAGQQRVRDAGLAVTPNEEAVPGADIVIYAVPDVALQAVTTATVPLQKRGSMVLTLDPAAAYAGLLYLRADLDYVVAHPTHPSVFLERTSAEEWADTFGGIAAAQNSVAALQQGDESIKPVAEEIIATMYGPVDGVYWASVHDLAVLEPTLNETIGCMIGQFLKDAMDTTVEKTDMDEDTVKAMFYGHVYIALTNALRGSNPFSDACLLAMDYGREALIKDDWERIFNDDDLEIVICKMLGIEAVNHHPEVHAPQPAAV
ncbi:phosphogluconate dehydrogenase C-terminal domain-containing protein [Raineyella sp. W15-4]|uniref:phosphogluconate dehydrogenase C-terminal domain-containing protein n=1 Tax=Raineyella sp. W15-4 TaxID=3081651 RepID=UPI0029543466|nr:phosphogluconate dehydrogenase C-terminal domain-containing protein [Raineyella sp. W15-4]WOQ16663.1 phosphogluconate dehydrogenase C-terminal domain-containing protein [Raineyella sp. W15-4]